MTASGSFRGPFSCVQTLMSPPGRREVRVHALVQGIRPYLLLFLVCLGLYVPGQTTLPVMDRDEARFVQATRQMLESEDYVVVRFQDELRAKKPVGIYWLQAAAVEAFSHPAKTDAWPYRLPSLLAALGTVLLTFRFAKALFEPRIALLSALIMATALMTQVEAHLAKTDAVLLFLTTLVQGSFALLYMQGKGGARAPSWVPLAFWLGIGCAILVKGPVLPVIVILTMITLAIADRNVAFLNGLRPVMGLLLAGAVVAPWAYAVSAETDGAFLSRAVSEDLIPKLLGAQESHGGVPGYYALLATLTFWPASLFLWPALGRSWRERALPGLRFTLAWVIPAWLMFELVPTKLPHYTLPLYPALAMMVAATLLAVRDQTYSRLAAWPAKIWYVVWSLIGLALAAAAIALPIVYGDPEGLDPWSIPAAAGALAAIGLAWWNIWKRRFLNALVGAMAASAIVYISLFQAVMPGLGDLWVSERLARSVEAARPGAPLAISGYAEPSLVFLTGTGTRLVTAPEVAQILLNTPNAIVAVEERDLDAFREALAQNVGLVQQLDVVTGFNYSKGKPVVLHLFTATPAG